MLECNNCYWKGESYDLILCQFAEETYKGCPSCEADVFEMDVMADYQIITCDGAIETMHEYDDHEAYYKAYKSFVNQGLEVSGYQLNFYGEYVIINSNEDGKKSN
jgi:hypothetical protein